MLAPRIVIDTNVVVAGLRSKRGASFQLLSAIGKGRFEFALSVPLVFEYEDALIRNLDAIGIETEDVDAVLDYLCSVAHLQEVFYLWRPHLPDPKDDMVLELAVAAGCQTIVTFNLHDFAGADQFGVSVARPSEFLSSIGAVL